MAAWARAAGIAHAPVSFDRCRGACVHRSDDVSQCTRSCRIPPRGRKSAPHSLGRRLLRVLPARDGLDRHRHRIVASCLGCPGAYPGCRMRRGFDQFLGWGALRRGRIGRRVRRPRIASDSIEAAQRSEEPHMKTPVEGDLWDNPLGTDGFEFIEYAAPDPAALGRLFSQMGFTAVAKHRSKNVLLYRQGGINFVVNAEPDSFAQAFARVHGPSICAIAFRVKDAAQALRRATELGAWAVE